MFEPVSLQAAGATWWVKPGYEGFVQDVLAPAAEAPEALPGAERIKHNRVRTVARIDGPEGPLFCKRFRVVRPGVRWLHLIKPSPARREWRVLRHLTERGILCPEPVVLAEERRGLLVGSVLATREVSGAEEVNRRIDRLREASAEDALRALAAALAAAIHALLQAGVDHPDLHVGNFLARPDGALVALDMHSAWIVPRPVGPRTVRRRLAKLAHSLAVGMVVPPPSALDEVRWFADAYAALDPRLGPGDALADALIDGARRVEATRLDSRGRRCLIDSTGFAVESTGDGRVYRLRTVPAGVVAQAVAAPAERVVRLGGGPVGRLELLGSDATALGRPLERRRFESPRAAMAVWRAARACDLRGIVTPRALALVVQGTLGSRRGLVLAEPLVGADLSAVAAGDPEPRVRRRLARAAGATVGRLHGSGLDPTALHPRVLTALEGDRAGEVGLTGLEFVRVAAPGPARAAEALVGLARGARASTREQRIFLAAYWRAGGERVFRSGGRPDRGALRAAIEAAAADAGASGGGGA